MRSPRLVTKELLKNLIDSGLTNKQIAVKLGKKPQYIKKRNHECKLKNPNRKKKSPNVNLSERLELKEKNLKRCTKCLKILSRSEFRTVKRKDLKPYKFSSCICCERIINREYSEKKRKGPPKPPMSEEQRRANTRKYKRKYKQKPEVKVRRAVRKRVSKLIKYRCSSLSISKLIGCTGEQLKNHLESQFEDGMSWDNYGFYGWHIDHVVPLSWFDLSDTEQLKKAAHYLNLQPKWAKDNLSKGNKYAG